MNENHRLIKDVSHALNFYMERTRREEGFDLSGILRPGYDLNQFKFNKLFGYSTGYDTTMKKILMPQLCLPKACGPESEEIKLREKFYKDELKYHLQFNRNQRRQNRAQSSKGFRSKSSMDVINYNKNGERKPRPKVPAGLLTIRSTHTPALTKREKLSMVNITSKIMSASSELCFQKEDILLMKNLADAKSQNTCYVRKSISQSRLEKQEEQERRYREFERLQLSKNSQREQQRSDEEKAEELEAAEKPDDKKDDQDVEEEEEQYEEIHQEEIHIRPVSEAKTRSKKKKEKLNDRDQKITQLEKLNEIKDGDLIKYRIVIKTGERLGSSTNATIRLCLYGSNGKSKQIKLKNSKTHKIPFRKGNTDVFDLEVFDIGRIKAVKIGHSEKNIESSWFIDYIGVENHGKSIVYTFETSDWFSTTSQDGCTARFLFKKSSASIFSDSASSASSSSRSSSNSSSLSNSSKNTTSTLKSGRSSRSSKKSEKSKSETKKDYKSDSSSSFGTENISRPQTSSATTKTRTLSELETRNSNRSERKASTSMSVRDAENEITSQKFDFSPSHSQMAFQSLQSKTTTNVNMTTFEAVELNRLDILKEKLQMSPLDISKTDLSGRSLMILACEYGFESIVKYLADNSDELINKDTTLGNFPVHVCAQFNHLDCMKILYDVGASLQSKNNDGNTPLHLAAESGNLNIVRWLIDHNVNATILNLSTEIPYEVAKRNGHIDTANYLAQPSGIQKQLTEDDYVDVAILKINESPYTRPNEPSPVELDRSSSKNQRASSRQSSTTSRKSTSRITAVNNNNKNTSSSSTASSSDSDSSLKKRKAGSNSRLSSANVKSNVSTKSSRSNSQAKEKPPSRSRKDSITSNSTTSSELNLNTSNAKSDGAKEKSPLRSRARRASSSTSTSSSRHSDRARQVRASSKHSVQSQKSLKSLANGSSVTLGSTSKTHSRKNSNAARLTSSETSSYNSGTDSDSDSLRLIKASSNSSDLKVKKSKKRL